jgi:uncharacterized integral membrane protein
MARDDDSTTQERRVPYRLIAMAIALGLLLWFAFANSKRVNIDFLVFERRTRLVYALAVSALLGVIIGWFAGRSRGK